MSPSLTKKKVLTKPADGKAEDGKLAEIPIPEIRKVATYERDYRPHHRLSRTYLRNRTFGAPPSDVVEYDLDNEDEDWLEQGFKLDVKSRSPAVGQAPVLSMDAKDEQERAEDVHALVGRLHKRNHFLSQLSCVCCAKEEHAGSQASARPDNPPNERYLQAP